ncbi:MAG: plasmid maintenance system antidote protein [bacterium]
MLPEIDKIKGVHPGAVLERELKSRKLKKGRFALEIKEYPQIITAITKRSRGINPALSIKLGRVLGCEPSYFQVLQAHFEIETERKLQVSEKVISPDLTRIRAGLFWDCDLNMVDWQNNSSAVILRIFERGNPDELAESIRFYGKDLITKTLKEIPSYLPTVKINARKFHIEMK